MVVHVFIISGFIDYHLFHHRYVGLKHRLLEGYDIYLVGGSWLLERPAYRANGLCHLRQVATKYLWEDRCELLLVYLNDTVGNESIIESRNQMFFLLQLIAQLM